MKKKKIILTIIALTLLVYASVCSSKIYSIYNIAQDIPMGEPDEFIAKNYYVNIGALQGVQKGTLLDVYRTISRLDPYSNNRRYNHDVKIGELLVLHAEENSSITLLKEINKSQSLYFEIDSMVIGDQVRVKTSD